MEGALFVADYAKTGGSVTAAAGTAVITQTAASMNASNFFFMIPHLLF